MPKDSLGIINLDTGEIAKIARVKSFKTPKERGGWLACLFEKSDVKDTTKAKEKKTKSEKGKKEKKTKTTKKDDGMKAEKKTTAKKSTAKKVTKKKE